MDKKFGMESEAIVRKRPEDKRPVHWREELSMALLWASGTMNISCFATGFLGWEFGLSPKQSIVITIFASILGGAVTAYCATLEPRPVYAKSVSVVSVSDGGRTRLLPSSTASSNLGWAAVACIIGGLALTAVSDGHVSLVLGIIILAVVALIISCFGLKFILIYQRYAWIIFFIIFLIIFGETGKYADNTTPASDTGANLSASVLSLLAIVYGSEVLLGPPWPVTTYVHYPVNVSRLKVFLLFARYLIS